MSCKRLHAAVHRAADATCRLSSVAPAWRGRRWRRGRPPSALQSGRGWRRCAEPASRPFSCQIRRRQPPPRRWRSEGSGGVDGERLGGRSGGGGDAHARAEQGEGAAEQVRRGSTAPCDKRHWCAVLTMVGGAGSREAKASHLGPRLKRPLLMTPGCAGAMPERSRGDKHGASVQAKGGPARGRRCPCAPTTHPPAC